MKQKNKNPEHNRLLAEQSAPPKHYRDFRLKVPLALDHFCEILSVSPQVLLSDFLDHLSHSSWKNSGSAAIREKLRAYFLESNYGNEYFTPEQITTLFREMDAMGTLFPRHADAMLLEQYDAWKSHYFKWWRSHWIGKRNRQ